jgi:hypothetical protein
MRCRSDRAGRRPSAVVALLAAALAAGCDLITAPFNTDDPSGDPYPIDVSLDTGAVRLFTRESFGAKDSIIDVLAPFSVVDTGRADAEVLVRTRSLYLLAENAARPGELVARARVSGAVIDMHPCETEPLCEAGGQGNVQPVAVTIGADLLAGDALRLALPQRQVSLLPDVAGSDSERAALCDAVLSGPFRGGGTLLLGGTELPYVGRRIAVPTCANPLPVFPEPAEPPTESLPRRRGVDLLLIMSTGVGVTLLSESAYERYRAYAGGAPVADLPAGSVTLVSGTIEGHLASISELALVGKSTKRGACGDVFAHRTLSPREEECTPNTPGCPCDSLPCGAPAVLELPTAVEVLVIQDSTPLLEGLRVELHPDEAEVDGVLGTDVLRRMTVDIDYPNNRVLMRCSRGPEDDATCIARPELPSHIEKRYRCRVAECVPDTPAYETLKGQCVSPD